MKDNLLTIQLSNVQLDVQLVHMETTTRGHVSRYVPYNTPPLPIVPLIFVFPFVLLTTMLIIIHDHALLPSNVAALPLEILLLRLVCQLRAVLMDFMLKFLQDYV